MTDSFKLDEVFNEQLRVRLEREVAVETANMLIRLAQEFIDVTAIDTPAGTKLFKHALTSRTLRTKAR